LSALFILVIDLGKVNYSLDSSFDYRCARAEVAFVLSAESFITVSYVIFKKSIQSYGSVATLALVSLLSLYLC
jgi:hypothetical protein